MSKRLVILLIVSALLIYGCTSPQAKQCPASCDDNNSCTNDYCDASTNFECVHANLSGEQVGCSGSAGLCKTKTCSAGSCGTSSIKNCYANEKYKFSFIYPEGWEAKGADMIVSIDPSEENNQSTCNILFLEIPELQSSNLSFKDFINSSRQQILINNHTLVSENKRTIGGIEGYELVESYNFDAFNVTYPLKFQHVIFIENNTFYQILCGSAEDKFEKYKPKFEGIVTTFKFND